MLKVKGNYKMSELPIIHKGQCKKVIKSGQMEVKNGGRAGCENLQPCKISAVVHFSSICGLIFLPNSDAHLRVRLGFFLLKSARIRWPI